MKPQVKYGVTTLENILKPEGYVITPTHDKSWSLAFEI
jgi:hypothetical protein